MEHKKCSTEFTFRGRQFNGYTSVEALESSCKFEFLSRDIVLATFPRSGTTVTSEVIWNILNVDSDSNNTHKYYYDKFPFLEATFRIEDPNYKADYVALLNSTRDDEYRLIKTHLPYEFIKENFEKVNPKLIVIMRNPKDCLVSNYHFYKHVPKFGWDGTFDEFFQLFLDGKAHTGCFFDNCVEWWSLRDRSNVLILFYEDLISNTSNVVAKIASFLNRPLNDKQLEHVLNKTSFEHMQKDSFINWAFPSGFRHLRKGVVGDWKNYFSDDHDKAMEEIIQRKFDGTGLKFVYD